MASDTVMSPASLTMQIKSRLQVAELDAIVHVTARSAIEESDTVGTLHFARWLNYHEQNKIGFFSAFDGALRKYIDDFAKYMGNTFNLLFKHVVNAPPLPVEKNVDAFYDWIVANNLKVAGFYSAYPTLSVQDIRAAARIVRGGVNEGVASPLSVVIPAKSPNHLSDLNQLIARSWPQFTEAADAIGTLHFARFVPLDNASLVYVSEYDGAFDKHVQDLSMRLGPMFDEMFEKVADPPPTPVQNNARAFGEWISARNLKPWLFYSAYPTLTVQDIRSKVLAHTS
jgi:hypothetical protein